MSQLNSIIGFGLLEKFSTLRIFFVAFLFCIFIRVDAQSCRLQSDVVFVIDTTYNLNYNYFTELLPSLRRIVDHLEVDSGRTRVGVLALSENASVVFDLGAYRTADAVKQALGGVTYRGSKPNTLDALRVLRERMFTTEAGARPQGRNGVMRLAIFILSNSAGINPCDLEAESRLLRGAGVEGYALGVGSYVPWPELASLASYPPSVNAFIIPTVLNMSSLETTMQGVICGDNSNCALSNCSTSTNGHTECMELFNRIECTCRQGLTGDDCNKACTGGADVIFVLQTSQSQTVTQSMMSIIHNITDNLAITGLNPASRVGFVTYDSAPNMVLELGGFVGDKAEIMRAMNVTNMTSSATETGDNNLAAAMRMVRQQMFVGGVGDRSDWQNVMIIMYDGMSDSPAETKAEAEAFKTAGIQVFAVGVSNNINRSEMENLVGAINSSQMYTMQNMNTVTSGEMIKNISAAICSMSAIPFSFTTAEKLGLGLGLGLGGGVLLVVLCILLYCCIARISGGRKTKLHEMRRRVNPVVKKPSPDQPSATTTMKNPVHVDTVVPVVDPRSYEHLNEDDRYLPVSHNYTPASPAVIGQDKPHLQPYTQYLPGSDAVTMEIGSASSSPVKPHPILSRTMSPDSILSGTSSQLGFKSHPLASRTVSPASPGAQTLPKGVQTPMDYTNQSEVKNTYEYAKDIDTNQSGTGNIYDDPDKYPISSEILRSSDAINGYRLPVDTIKRPLPSIPYNPEGQGRHQYDLHKDSGSMSYDYVMDNSEYALPIKTAPVPQPTNLHRCHTVATPQDYLNASETKWPAGANEGLVKGNRLTLLGAHHTPVNHTTSDVTGRGLGARGRGEVDRAELLKVLHMRGAREKEGNVRDVPDKEKQNTNNVKSFNTNSSNSPNKSKQKVCNSSGIPPPTAVKPAAKHESESPTAQKKKLTHAPSQASNSGPALGQASNPGPASSIKTSDFLRELKAKQAQVDNSPDYQDGELYPDMTVM